MQKSTSLSHQNALLRNSAIVFAGGACYGILASVVKFSYADGFSFQQLVFSQSFFALIAFTLIALFDKVRGFKRTPLKPKQKLKLALMGIVTSGTTTFYYLSLSYIPANVAITLLFQFTWLGLVFEVFTTRKRPTNAALLSAAIIFTGTLFASGIIGGSAIESLHPLGIVFGLCAAICCASFMFLSGRVEAHLPVQQRGLWACCGYILTGIILCPNYFASGALQQGIWKYGLVLGPLGFVLPMLLFGIGCKYLSPGLSTIMASSELPISIFCAVFLLHEPTSLLQLLGVGCILLGIVIAQIPGLRNREKPNLNFPETSIPHEYSQVPLPSNSNNFR